MIGIFMVGPPASLAYDAKMRPPRGTVQPIRGVRASGPW
jgi:hypothetical protein